MKSEKLQALKELVENVKKTRFSQLKLLETNNCNVVIRLDLSVLMKMPMEIVNLKKMVISLNGVKRDVEINIKKVLPLPLILIIRTILYIEMVLMQIRPNVEEKMK